MNNLSLYLFVSCFLFAIGLTVVVSKKNLIMVLMGIELMLNGVNLNFVAFSKFDKIQEQGQIFSIFIMIISACEVAIALAIILKIREHYKNIDPSQINELKN